MEINQEEKVIVEDLQQDLRALLNVALIDQLVDTEDAVDLQDADQVEDHGCRLWIVKQGEHIDPKARRARVVPEDLLGALDFFSKTVQIGRTQVNDHICNVQQVSENVQVSVSRVENGPINGDAHGDEKDRVDCDENDEVRPALSPRVVARYQ